ncbi:MAG: uroporphyrinogen decarboxylase [Proteobacteria bacterium]|nr:uroporphyrinogen decarboxylase [Pseudomonadota bacterium]MDA0941296.1 uroporphyrinogen decarboxylase [Pseudomonadota bacterium]MDA1034550.1 uroporphyrinogen decarboxylase [Pseudomonadota bacterium]
MKITNDSFLKTLRLEKTPYTPVWIMRQAGRYLPEYQQTRKNAGSFMDLCRNKNFATEVTLQPLDRYPLLDASILFSDILTIPDAMGLGLNFAQGEGPIFDKPLQNEQAVQALDIPSMDKLSYVFDAVKSIKNALNGRVPLIGFAGSPWTLATYMVEGQGGSDFLKIKKMAYERKDLIHHILKINAESVTQYLTEQIKSGVDAVMIFDSWGGRLSHHEYSELSLNYMKVILDNLDILGYEHIPKIIFTKGGGQWIDQQIIARPDAIGLDWQTSLKKAREITNDKIALQGNMDPAILLGSDKKIEEEVKKVLDDYGRGEGHIFNLGHGITQFTDPDKVDLMLQTIREYSQQYH